MAERPRPSALGGNSPGRRDGPSAEAVDLTVRRSARRHRHLDAEALAKLANLQLRVRAAVDGALAGLHRSPHRGASIEFAEHKEYSPGDDLKRLDWKAYAKFDRYFIRQYEDETELRAYLLLDCSASMGYGDPLSKLEFGSVLVASLAYLLARQRDQPALVAFSDRVRSYVPPRSRGGHTSELLAELEGMTAEGTTDLHRAVRHVTEIIARRSLVVVVSDLFDLDDSALKLLRQLRAHRHEVVVLHLLHDDELRFPFTELTLFEAMESDRTLLADPGGVRDGYLREIERFCAQIEKRCREGEVAYHRVSTLDAVDQVLLRLLSRGERRRGR